MTKAELFGRSTCKPIIFSPEMVRAILDGRKTQTRRVVEPQPSVTMITNPKTETTKQNTRTIITTGNGYSEASTSGRESEAFARKNVPRSIKRILWAVLEYKPGDVLWVKEAWCDIERFARLWLRVTDVRCERLHDVTRDDILAEGGELTKNGIVFQGLCFGEYWDEINGKKHPWESNPWVWVYTFERMERKI